MLGFTFTGFIQLHYTFLQCVVLKLHIFTCSRAVQYLVMNKTILAFVGMPGSGKSTCIDYLTANDLPSIYFGGVVVEEVKKRNSGVVNEKMEKIVREEFRKKDGMAAIAKRALPAIHTKLSVSEVVILDGLYSWSEYTLLKKEFGDSLIIIAIAANKKLRHERLAKRPVRPLTSDEVSRREISEIENLEKGGPIAIADYTLTNNADPEMLIEKLDALLKHLKVDYFK